MMNEWSRMMKEYMIDTIKKLNRLHAIKISSFPYELWNNFLNKESIAYSEGIESPYNVYFYFFH
jgi:hypothetical protein